MTFTICHTLSLPYCERKRLLAARLLPKANVCKENLKEKKKVSNYAKRLLKVLIAAVTTFIDHQNKGPGAHRKHQIPEHPAKTFCSRRTVGYFKEIKVKSMKIRFTLESNTVSDYVYLSLSLYFLVCSLNTCKGVKECTAVMDSAWNPGAPLIF
ncbi:hypothetical protein BCV71DRAFT_232619 [Rhizopus microsporus]|uniref:Uncharacterized protein n=1 Tax=Rhizopus microsporus TaxID=58291 RepID=A0A1X0S9W8_RHIZD|nr:hypothetical protein BCV71DRAFT_232619 [Rhizopus microsporus]